MKSIKVLMFPIMFMTLACNGDDGTPDPRPNTLAQDIENIIKPMVDDKTTVGAAVGIVKPGGAKEMFFYGEKNKGQSDIPDENTLFEIGSITKTMTATVLAEMVLNSEIILDDAVEDYLPEIENFPNYNGEKITFKHLANHTSSLPRLPGNLTDGNFDERQPYLNYTKEMMFDFLDGYNLPRPVGSEEEYSNLATGLLGYVLAKIKGKSLAVLFEEIIFDELNMAGACSVIPSEYSNIAEPYDEHRNPVSIWDMSEATLGAGGVKASLKDMLLFLEANMGKGSSGLIETLELTHENTQTLNVPFTVGLAWNNIYKAEDNTTLTWHNGGTAGSVSVIGFIKELDMGFVLLFNTEIVDRTGQNLIELAKGIEVIEAMKRH
ncbi:MAG: beta-lactamase family protein [Cytophagales bacterium]|nr:beta-lactamase family protein [Cytophagales bacterium]